MLQVGVVLSVTLSSLVERMKGDISSAASSLSVSRGSVGSLNKCESVGCHTFAVFTLTYLRLFFGSRAHISGSSSLKYLKASSNYC
jgi:hypothetical protein